MANVDSLAREINRQLSLIPTEAQGLIDQVGDELANEAVKDLKKESPKDTGKYAKSWRKKKENAPAGGTIYRIHNDKFPWLTHLLEYGHIIHGTGERTRAFPHISVVDKKIREEYPQRVEEAMKNAFR